MSTPAVVSVILIRIAVGAGFLLEGIQSSIIGIGNFFADMTYEGARSITGPFLGSLGASATVIGVVAGTGELLGYGLRSVGGYFADKTQRYWLIVFVGYVINMLAVPALALTGLCVQGIS